jgi:sugar phosphate isomerase/epimerase
MQFVLFTDNLASLKIRDVCTGAKHAGFEGVDLTLRPGGHVLPENAEVGLSDAKRIADDVGVSIPMVSTAVTDADSPHAEAVFASAAHYGARHVKLGYWPYHPFGTLAKQVDQTIARLQRLVKLGEKYNVLPCVHCHSGAMVVNCGMMQYLVLRDFKPGQVGAYVDPMHMTAEGGVDGWEMGLDLVAPWLALVGMKNFRWKEIERGPKGQARFKTQYVPLPDGQAPLPQFVERLKQLKYDGIVSFHSEYHELKPAELLEQSRKDLAYFKTLL